MPSKVTKGPEEAAEAAGASETTVGVGAPTTLACPNCGTVAGQRTRYCTGCGQRQGESLLTVRVLLGDLLEDLLALDGRLPRTLHGLFRPGHLTREYAAGRIMRYVRPFKLYLACSVIFFLALSVSLRIDPDNIMVDIPTVTEEIEAPTESTGEASPPDTALAMASSGSRVQRTATADRSSLLNFFQNVLGPFTKNLSEDPGVTAQRLIDRMLRDAPKVVFVLLPIFALFLKILYIRRRRLYAEHLVFILHAHAFGFLLAAPLLLVPDSWPTGILWLALPAYLLWAMRRVYGQSWMRTIFKFFIFGWVYFTSVVITLVTVTILAAMAVGGTFSF
jgi:hypothetical protein